MQVRYKNDVLVKNQAARLPPPPAMIDDPKYKPRA
jgi:hypothetical protein